MSIFIHETAEVSAEAIIGKDTKVWNQAQIRERAKIGQSCIISKNVYIDFDVKIGDRVKIQNNVNVYHGVTIEDDVFLGPSMTFTNDMFPRAFNDDWSVSETIVKKGEKILVINPLLTWTTEDLETFNRTLTSVLFLQKKK